MNRTPAIDVARILDHDGRRAHHKLCLELCSVCAVMTLAIVMAVLGDGGMMAGAAINSPLALQALLAHHFRL